MPETGCHNLSLALSLSRRDVIRSGALGLLGFSLPRFLEAREITQKGVETPAAPLIGRILRQGEVLHLAVHVGRAGAARNVGHEARRPRAGPRRVSADSDRGSQAYDFRAFSASCAAARSPGDHSLGASRRRQPPDRHSRAADRPADPAAGRRRIPRRLAPLRRCAGPPRRGNRPTALPSYVQMRPEIPNAAPRFVEQSHGQGAGWMGPAFSHSPSTRIPANPITGSDNSACPRALPFGGSAIAAGLLGTVDDQARGLEAPPKSTHSPATTAAPTTFWPAARRSKRLTSPAKTRGSAIATAGMPTASRCCRPAAWSKPAFRW